MQSEKCLSKALFSDHFMLGGGRLSLKEENGTHNWTTKCRCYTPGPWIPRKIWFSGLQLLWLGTGPYVGMAVYSYPFQLHWRKDRISEPSLPLLEQWDFHPTPSLGSIFPWVLTDGIVADILMTCTYNSQSLYKCLWQTVWTSGSF